MISVATIEGRIELPSSESLKSGIVLASQERMEVRTGRESASGYANPPPPTRGFCEKHELASTIGVLRRIDAHYNTIKACGVGAC
jgi:hypothetical protein